MDSLVDGDYVTRSDIGLDQSETYMMRRYDFTPKHFEKTIVLSGCLHGNEYSGFYSLTQFLELLVSFDRYNIQTIQTNFNSKMKKNFIFF